MRGRTPLADDTPKRAPPAPMRESAPDDPPAGGITEANILPCFSSPASVTRMGTSMNTLDEHLTTQSPPNSRSHPPDKQEPPVHYRTGQTTQDKRSRLSNVINSLYRKVPASDRSSVERNLETLEKYVMTVLNGVIKEAETDETRDHKKSDDKSYNGAENESRIIDDSQPLDGLSSEASAVEPAVPSVSIPQVTEYEASQEEQPTNLKSPLASPGNPLEPDGKDPETHDPPLDELTNRIQMESICRELLSDLVNEISQTMEEKSPILTSLQCSLPLEKVAPVLNICDSLSTPNSSKSTVRHLCLYCDRKFLSISLRQRHTERVHQVGGGRRSDRNTRKTNCQYCSEKCDNLDGLFQHMTISHYDKYHGCLHCSTRYTMRDELVIHNKELHPNEISDDSLKDKLIVKREIRSQIKIFTPLKLNLLPRDDTKDTQDFDSTFYNNVSCNIRENLLHHLDGKLHPSGPLIPSSCYQANFYEPTQVQLPIDISLTAATPVYSKEYSVGESDNSSEYAQKPGKVGSSHPRRVSFEKYNFPKKYDGKEPWTCIGDLSKFDISTQLTLRKKQQLLKEKLSAIEGIKCDVTNVASTVTRDSENSEMSESMGEGEDSSVSDQRLGTQFSGEFGNFLRLRKWNEYSNSVKEEKIVYAELTGEWSRPRVYICGACSSKHQTLKELEEHKVLSHPHVWCSHLEFSGDQTELDKHVVLPGRGVSIMKAKDAILSEKICTKCLKTCSSLSELHKHMLECGGDQTWLLGLFGNGKKKCKWRPFGSRRRRQRGMKRNIQNSQDSKNQVNKTPKEKLPSGPRIRPSDRESIEKMLANLPAKRSTRKVTQEINLRSQSRMCKIQTRSRKLGEITSNSRLSRKAVLRNKLIKNAKSFQRKRCLVDNISAAIESVISNYNVSTRRRRPTDNSDEPLNDNEKISKNVTVVSKKRNIKSQSKVLKSMKNRKGSMKFAPGNKMTRSNALNKCQEKLTVTRRKRSNDELASVSTTRANSQLRGNDGKFTRTLGKNDSDAQLTSSSHSNSLQIARSNSTRSIARSKEQEKMNVVSSKRVTRVSTDVDKMPTLEPADKLTLRQVESGKSSSELPVLLPAAKVQNATVNSGVKRKGKRIVMKRRGKRSNLGKMGERGGQNGKIIPTRNRKTQDIPKEENEDEDGSSDLTKKPSLSSPKKLKSESSIKTDSKRTRRSQSSLEDQPKVEVSEALDPPAEAAEKNPVRKVKRKKQSNQRGLRRKMVKGKRKPQKKSTEIGENRDTGTTRKSPRKLEKKSPVPIDLPPKLGELLSQSESKIQSETESPESEVRVTSPPESTQDDSECHSKSLECEIPANLSTISENVLENIENNPKNEVDTVTELSKTSPNSIDNLNIKSQFESLEDVAHNLKDESQTLIFKDQTETLKSEPELSIKNSDNPKGDSEILTKLLSPPNEEPITHTSTPDTPREVLDNPMREISSLLEKQPSPIDLVSDLVTLSFEHLQQESSNSNIDSGKENSSEIPITITKSKIPKPKKARGLKRDRQSKRTLNNVIGILTEGVNIPIEVQQSVVLTVQTSIEGLSLQSHPNNMQTEVSRVELGDNNAGGGSHSLTHSATVDPSLSVDSGNKETPESDSGKIEGSSQEASTPSVHSEPPTKPNNTNNAPAGTTTVEQFSNDIILDLSRRKQKGKGSFLEKIVSKIAKQKDALLDHDVGSLLDNAVDELSIILDDVGPKFADNDVDADLKSPKDSDTLIKHDDSTKSEAEATDQNTRENENSGISAAVKIVDNESTKTNDVLPMAESINQEESREVERTAKKRSSDTAPTNPKRKTVNEEDNTDEALDSKVEDEIYLSDIMKLINSPAKPPPSITCVSALETRPVKRKIMEAEEQPDDANEEVSVEYNSYATAGNKKSRRNQRGTRKEDKSITRNNRGRRGNRRNTSVNLRARKSEGECGILGDGELSKSMDDKMLESSVLLNESSKEHIIEEEQLDNSEEIPDIAPEALTISQVCTSGIIPEPKKSKRKVSKKINQNIDDFENVVTSNATAKEEFMKEERIINSEATILTSPDVLAIPQMSVPEIVPDGKKSKRKVTKKKTQNLKDTMVESLGLPNEVSKPELPEEAQLNNSVDITKTTPEAQTNLQECAPEIVSEQKKSKRRVSKKKTLSIDKLFESLDVHNESSKDDDHEKAPTHNSEEITDPTFEVPTILQASTPEILSEPKKLKRKVATKKIQTMQDKLLESLVLYNQIAKKADIEENQTDNSKEMTEAEPEGPMDDQVVVPEIVSEPKKSKRKVSKTKSLSIDKVLESLIPPESPKNDEADGKQMLDSKELTEIASEALPDLPVSTHETTPAPKKCKRKPSKRMTQSRSDNVLESLVLPNESSKEGEVAAQKIDNFAEITQATPETAITPRVCPPQIVAEPEKSKKRVSKKKHQSMNQKELDSLELLNELSQKDEVEIQINNSKEITETTLETVMNLEAYTPEVVSEPKKSKRRAPKKKPQKMNNESREGVELADESSKKVEVESKPTESSTEIIDTALAASTKADPEIVPTPKKSKRKVSKKKSLADEHLDLSDDEIKPDEISASTAEMDLGSYVGDNSRTNVTDLPLDQKMVMNTVSTSTPVANPVVADKPRSRRKHQGKIDRSGIEVSDNNAQPIQRRQTLKRKAKENIFLIEELLDFGDDIDSPPEMRTADEVIDTEKALIATQISEEPIDPIEPIKEPVQSKVQEDQPLAKLPEDPVQDTGVNEPNPPIDPVPVVPETIDDDTQSPKKRASGNFAVVHTKSGEILIVEKKKKFTKEAARFFCDVCSTSFTRKSSLKKHNLSQSHILQVSKCSNEQELCLGETREIPSSETFLLNATQDECPDDKVEDKGVEKVEFEAPLANSTIDTIETAEPDPFNSQLEEELLDEEICKITENMTHDEYVLTDHISPEVEEGDLTEKAIEVRETLEKKSQKGCLVDENVELESVRLDNEQLIPETVENIAVTGGDTPKTLHISGTLTDVPQTILGSAATVEDIPETGDAPEPNIHEIPSPPKTPDATKVSLDFSNITEKLKGKQFLQNDLNPSIDFENSKVKAIPEDLNSTLEESKVFDTKDARSSNKSRRKPKNRRRQKKKSLQAASESEDSDTEILKSQSKNKIVKSVFGRAFGEKLDKVMEVLDDWNSKSEPDSQEDTSKLRKTEKSEKRRSKQNDCQEISSRCRQSKKRAEERISRAFEEESIAYDLTFASIDKEPKISQDSPHANPDTKFDPNLVFPSPPKRKLLNEELSQDTNSMDSVRSRVPSCPRERSSTPDMVSVTSRDSLEGDDFVSGINDHNDDSGDGNDDNDDEDNDDDQMSVRGRLSPFYASNAPESSISSETMSTSNLNNSEFLERRGNSTEFSGEKIVIRSPVLSSQESCPGVVTIAPTDAIEDNALDVPQEIESKEKTGMARQGKVLNFDEELFVECCSRLKATTENELRGAKKIKLDPTDDYQSRDETTQQSSQGIRQTHDRWRDVESQNSLGSLLESVNQLLGEEMYNSRTERRRGHHREPMSPVRAPQTDFIRPDTIGYEDSLDVAFEHNNKLRDKIQQRMRESENMIATTFGHKVESRNYGDHEPHGRTSPPTLKTQENDFRIRNKINPRMDGFLDVALSNLLHRNGKHDHNGSTPMNVLAELACAQVPSTTPSHASQSSKSTPISHKPDKSPPSPKKSRNPIKELFERKKELNDRKRSPAPKNRSKKKHQDFPLIRKSQFGVGLVERKKRHPEKKPDPIKLVKDVYDFDDEDSDPKFTSSYRFQTEKLSETVVNYVKSKESIDDLSEVGCTELRNKNDKNESAKYSDNDQFHPKTKGALKSFMEEKNREKMGPMDSFIERKHRSRSRRTESSGKPQKPKRKSRSSKKRNRAWYEDDSSDEFVTAFKADDVGVGITKTQRNCSKGKQNLFAELSTSESDYEPQSTALTKNESEPETEHQRKEDKPSELSSWFEKSEEKDQEEKNESDSPLVIDERESVNSDDERSEPAFELDDLYREDSSVASNSEDENRDSKEAMETPKILEAINTKNLDEKFDRKFEEDDISKEKFEDDDMSKEKFEDDDITMKIEDISRKKFEDDDISNKKFDDDYSNRKFDDDIEKKYEDEDVKKYEDEENVKKFQDLIPLDEALVLLDVPDKVDEEREDREEMEAKSLDAAIEELPEKLTCNEKPSEKTSENLPLHVFLSRKVQESKKKKEEKMKRLQMEREKERERRKESEEREKVKEVEFQSTRRQRKCAIGKQGLLAEISSSDEEFFFGEGKERTESDRSRKQKRESKEKRKERYLEKKHEMMIAKEQRAIEEEILREVKMKRVTEMDSPPLPVDSAEPRPKPKKEKCHPKKNGQSEAPVPAKTTAQKKSPAKPPMDLKDPKPDLKRSRKSKTPKKSKLPDSKARPKELPPAKKADDDDLRTTKSWNKVDEGVGVAIGRRKRAAANQLYYWSSSTDDDEEMLPVPVVEEEDDRQEQHGWIVGDSHKKMITMLAMEKQLKEKRRRSEDDDAGKTKSKKHRNSTS